MRYVFPLVTGLALAACAADDPSTSTTVEELKSSFPVKWSRPAVGEMWLNGEWCTGTLIKPNEVLTAGHCVTSSNNPNGGAALGSFFVWGRDRKQHFYNFDGWRTYWGQTLGEGDLAILHLTENVPSSIAKPLRVRSDRPPNGTMVTTYGFGYSNSNCTAGANSKRRASFRVGVTPYFLCPGDSGGPVFDPQGRIAFMNDTYNNPGDGFAHPYAHTDWIYQTGAYASSGDLTPPWISSLSVSGYPEHLDVGVSDNDGVDFVDYYIDGDLVGFAEDGPTFTDFLGVPSGGVHTAMAIAYDFEGNARSFSQTLDFTPQCSWATVLWPGQTWASPSGGYRFVFQQDGNVVLYSPDGVARWATSSLNYPGRTASHMKLECNGNLALYDTNGATWWQSNTANLGIQSIAVQDDCNVVLYDANHVAKWSTGTFGCMPPPPPPLSSCGGLPSGGVLGTDQMMPSCDGRFRLVMQLDGNLVLYQGGTAIWATNTFGSNYTAVMQADGNFVVYNSSHQAVWTSNTYGKNGATLSVQNDGNVVMYQGGTPVWATNTCCR